MFLETPGGPRQRWGWGGLPCPCLLVEYTAWHPPRLSARHFLPAPAPEVRPVWGRGGGWPVGGQGAASIPALQLCPLVTPNTYTHGSALHSCPQEALSGRLPLLPQPPGLAATPRTHTCTRTHTYYTHTAHTDTHTARALCYLGLRQPHTHPQRCFLPALSISSLAVFTQAPWPRAPGQLLVTSAPWHHAVLEGTPSRHTGLSGGIGGPDALPLPLPLGRASPQKHLSPSHIGPAGFSHQPS